MTNVKLKMSNDGITIIKRALEEDIGAGDITTLAVVPADKQAEARIIAKEAGVVAGLNVAREVFSQVDKRIKFMPKVKDGATVKAKTTLALLRGPARGILSGERVALNFLQRLSGIATLTNKFVQKAKSAKILDTRKTTPGLRALEKYAVKVGGGVNHRFGLYDEFLVKDNHIAIAGGIQKALKALRGKKGLKVVEAKTLAEVKQIIKEGGADRILLDNMSLRNLKEAASLCRRAKIKTEASGGITLDRIKLIAKAGVDYVSVGSLTHSARALDISLDILL